MPAGRDMSERCGEPRVPARCVDEKVELLAVGQLGQVRNGFGTVRGGVAPAVPVTVDVDNTAGAEHDRPACGPLSDGSGAAEHENPPAGSVPERTGDGAVRIGQVVGGAREGFNLDTIR